MKKICLAGCIIQNEQGGILLLHRNTSKRVQWEIPGGKIDEHEEAGATACRELQEELGVTVAQLRQLGGKLFTEDGYEMEYTWFGATITSGTPTIMEPDTHDDFRFFTLKELTGLAAELSPNTANFVTEWQQGRITL